MIGFSELPHDIESCHALLQEQAATMASQASTIASHQATIAVHAQKIEELTAEQEKLRKLLSQFIHGHRSEKRVLPAENQSLSPLREQRGVPGGEGRS